LVEGLGKEPDSPYYFWSMTIETQRASRMSVDEQLSQPRIRLVLLDDNVLFRESLARLLVAERDFELVAQCTMPPESLKVLSVDAVDVLLVRFAVAKEFISSARQDGYEGKFLVIARNIDVKDTAAVLSRGASGVFLESEGPARLVQAIRLIATGEVWVGQQVIEVLAARYPHYDDRRWGTLTEREEAVLNGVVDGLSNRKIGAWLGLSESTVKTTLQQLFGKAGVRTRSQLVRIVLEDPPASASRAGRQIRAGNG
jgi:two-component system nitrate/nitrite response regulator NarL